MRLFSLNLLKKIRFREENKLGMLYNGVKKHNNDVCTY